MYKIKKLLILIKIWIKKIINVIAGIVCIPFLPIILVSIIGYELTSAVSNSSDSVKRVINITKILIKKIAKVIIDIVLIPFIPIIFIGIIGHALFIKVFGSSNDVKKAFDIIKTDFTNILKIVYLPFSLLGALGKTLFYKSNSFGTVVSNSINRFSVLAKKKIHEYFPSVNRRKFERLKKHLFINRNETFLNSNLHHVVLLATFGLQIISFFTTFRGTLSFFEGVHWIAPIVFTCVLQGVLLVLANVAFSKKRRYTWRIVLLIFLCGISIILSYVGIANSALPPTDDYKREYTKFYNEYDEIYKELEQKNIASDVNYQLQTIYQSIDNAKKYAQNQIDNLDTQLIELSAIRRYAISTTVNPQTGERTYISVETDEYKDAIAKNKEIEKEKNDIQQQLNNVDYTSLQTYIANSNLDTITDNKSLTTYVNDNQNIVIEYNSIISQYNSLAQMLNEKYNGNFEVFPTDISDILKFKIINDISKFELKNFENIVSEANEYIKELDANKGYRSKKIYSMLLGDTKRAIYNDRVLLNAKEEIDLKCKELDNSLKVIDDSDLNTKYDDLKETKDDLIFYDSYLIAFSRFASNLSYAIIMMFFAFLVDGLTVLIPLFTEKRRESILYAKSNLDILSDHEDILEDLLISCAFDINKDAPEVDSDGYYDDSVYLKMIDTLTDYLNAFEPSPYTTDLGYSKKLPVTSLVSDDKMEFYYPEANSRKFSKKYDELNSLLLDLKYIKYVSKYEYYLLKCDYLNEIPHEDKSINSQAIKHNTEKGYFLLKGQFAMWLNESKAGFFNMKKGSKNQ